MNHGVTRRINDTDVKNARMQIDVAVINVLWIIKCHRVFSFLDLSPSSLACWLSWRRRLNEYQGLPKPPLRFGLIPPLAGGVNHFLRVVVSELDGV